MVFFTSLADAQGAPFSRMHYMILCFCSAVCISVSFFSLSFSRTCSLIFIFTSLSCSLWCLFFFAAFFHSSLLSSGWMKILQELCCPTIRLSYFASVCGWLSCGEDFSVVICQGQSPCPQTHFHQFVKGQWLRVALSSSVGSWSKLPVHQKIS